MRFHSPKNLLPGDVIVATGGGLRDRFTQLFTRCKWNHVALVTGEGTFIEADMRGTLYRVHLECDDFVVVRHKSVSKEDGIRIVGFSRQHIGKRYSALSNIEIGIRILLNKRKHRSMVVNDRNGVNCCQLVSKAFELVGYEIHPDYVSGAILPGDFLDSPLFHRVDGERESAVLR